MLQSPTNTRIFTHVRVHHVILFTEKLFPFSSEVCIATYETKSLIDTGNKLVFANLVDFPRI